MRPNVSGTLGRLNLREDKLRGLFAITFALTLLASAWSQPDPNESKARAALSKIDEYKAPVYDEPTGDADYKRIYVIGYLRYLEKRNEMIWEFVQEFPGHERSKPLMEEYFTNLGGGTSPAINERVDKAVLDIDTVILHSPADWVKTMASYYRAYYNLCKVLNRLRFLDSVEAPADDNERRQVIQFGLALIGEFTTAYPKEIRAVRLLDLLAESCHDPVSARALYARILADYPGHPNKTLYEGKMRREDKLGEPFEMTFEDALSGDQVDIKDYAGKVVLVVFWAKSVPVCEKLMAEVKRLWFRYQHEGLEVIDVSLDSVTGGGKKAYNDFVKDHKLEWKHYFQGSGLDSEFSKSWGVNSLPTWFLVDRKGNLRHTDAAKKPEDKIKGLIKESEMTRR